MFSFLFLDFQMLHAEDTIELPDSLHFEELLRRLGLPALGSYHQAYMEQNTDTRHPKGYVPRLRIQIQALCHPIARNSSFYQWATRKL